jgi:hypothetical protein
MFSLPTVFSYGSNRPPGKTFTVRVSRGEPPNREGRYLPRTATNRGLSLSSCGLPVGVVSVISVVWTEGVTVDVTVDVVFAVVVTVVVRVVSGLSSVISEKATVPAEMASLMCIGFITDQETYSYLVISACFWPLNADSAIILKLIVEIFW